MRRTYVDPRILASITAGEIVTLPKDAGHHLTRVLRLPVDTTVELFDGEGRIAHGRLVSDIPTQVRVDVVTDARRTLPPLIIGQAMVRAAKLEEVVRRGTELGASAVRCFQAERSMVDGERARLPRLCKIAQEAARQSERSDVPEVLGAMDFEALLADVRMFRGEVVMGVLGASTPLTERLAASPVFRSHGMWVLVGPEGGLAPDEVDALQGAGAAAVSLGPHVLRTETAGLVALSAALVVLHQL